MRSLFAVMSFVLSNIDYRLIAVNQLSRNKINTPTIESFLQCGKRDFERRWHRIVIRLQSYHSLLWGSINNVCITWYSKVPSSALMHERQFINALIVFAAFSWISPFGSSALRSFASSCFHSFAWIVRTPQTPIKLFKVIDTLLIVLFIWWNFDELNCCTFVELFRNTY